MDEDKAIEIIKAEILGSNSVFIKLSLKSGIDEDAFKRLLDAMDFLTKLYKNRDQVPKVVAGAFVDLTPYFERCLELYSEEERNRIFDLKERIVSSALTMFGIE